MSPADAQYYCCCLGDRLHPEGPSESPRGHPEQGTGFSHAGGAGLEDTQESVSASAVCPFSGVIPRCMSSFSIGRCVLFVCRLIILRIFPLRTLSFIAPGQATLGDYSSFHLAC